SKLFTSAISIALTMKLFSGISNSVSKSNLDTSNSCATRSPASELQPHTTVGVGSEHEIVVRLFRCRQFLDGKLLLAEFVHQRGQDGEQVAIVLGHPIEVAAKLPVTVLKCFGVHFLPPCRASNPSCMFVSRSGAAHTEGREAVWSARTNASRC